MPQASPKIPHCAWQRPLGQGWTDPYRVRYASNLDDGPWHGMPLGGFGAGCIGRSPGGDFNLWHLDGGEHLFANLPACQFSVFEQTGGASQAYALSTAAPEDNSLSAWQRYPASSEARSTGSYQALYPRSWFTYQNLFQAQLTCEQFTPILPHNYRETSYPVAVFEWTAHNPADQPLTLSILLSWQNTVGWFRNLNPTAEITIRDDGSPVYDYQSGWGRSAGNWNRSIATPDLTGLVMEGNRSDAHTTQEGEGQWCIALGDLPPGAKAFTCSRWNPVGDGAELWDCFSQSGAIPQVDDATLVGEGEQIAGAIAVRFTLQPGETLQIPFALAWDFPVTEFAQGVNYFRRYTDFFGTDGKQAEAIARTALTHYKTWQQQIRDWQQPILDRTDLSEPIKMALMNELYDLTDGGTLWSAASEADAVGQFAVLECIDYRWYESLDVRLYGSFALLELWPELEKSVIRAFARAIPAADESKRVIGYYKTIGVDMPLAQRKVANATPHDLGAPNEHVWEKTNYTAYQDCNLWKDLGSDYVLQVYRDYLFTGADDIEFLADCWPAVVAALDYLKEFDLDGDGIPENSGAPDQTFDDWRLQGISAYCGGLWIAALEAAIAMAQILETQTDIPVSEALTQHQAWLAQAKPLYQATLWNGRYYNLDSGSGSQVVMADQLCGQFYARLLALPDIVPQDCAKSALSTVYEACFLNFKGAQFGAANGLLLDGSPVNPGDTHPLEVWTGINFGIAAFLVQMGLKDEAFRLTETVVGQVYENGLQFRTPEAITSVGTFRASHYLRAMAIWALVTVMDQTGSEG
ncbi:MAG: bile acid beta-glucosidase [Synechococcales cyanobacterium RM1_1_8]|nr:bile acid beta-glucosidase [Synechococcales cyanobacterium RM1_1_8]